MPGPILAHRENMGCCASSHEAPATGKHRHSSQSPCKGAAGGGAPPPPSLVEKETVKEVLSSEIPKPKADPDKVDEDQKKTSAVLVAACVGNEIEEKAVKIENPVPAAPASPPSEASLVSDMCSWSESVSAATVIDTRDGNDEDDGRSREVRQRVGRAAAPKFPRNCRASPPGSVRGRRQPGVATSSPVRRSEASPRPSMGRSGSGREAGQLTPTRRVVPRQELGEVSRRRRSMSPATRSGSGAGRSPSVRKTGRAPGVRIPAKATAAESSGQAEETWRMEEHDNDESLENPLVSLECFIFL